MGTRGRKSAASLTVVSVSGRPRLKPPKGLRPEVAVLFQSIVAACDARHFTKSDLPLILQYCEATLLAEKASASLAVAVLDPETDKVNPYLVVHEKAVRAMVALSGRLRLSPQSRQDPKTAHRRAKQVNETKPWEGR